MDRKGEPRTEEELGNDELIQRVIEPLFEEEAIPDEWLADQAGTAHAGRMAQLEADVDLVRRAQLERFSGPAWAKLSRGLAQRLSR